MIALAVVALWPTHLDGTDRSRVRPLLELIAGYGIPENVSYAVLEFSANVLLFAPAGLLLAILVSRRFRAVVPLVGLVLSVAAETAQHLFLPGRTADYRDVISNTLGFALGWLVVALVSRARHGAFRRRERHRHRETPTGAIAVVAQAVSTPVLSSTMSTPPSSTR